ncbi:Hsp20/alpha crystallin family protein [Desulfurispirillum indicum]|uniref:Heat shock protein Hsp20 n=1 Tax=Desulfurispirillum indicum (strain ATCC BAA-1389 / DSM 22839 / S5) TaxID=653733 RepID=E6W236_DESIS|nr:Hsp20/alpha crystallin family protein [Desulfurispirillum indicum]ADU66662.1 heat shock protein Hsp20 [Desulfurispirillum indicum S5]UCZ55980.1 Hsp20/alpha crystallin family protein [Desulfurispirillum indicum]
MLPSPLDPLRPLREFERQFGELLDRFSGKAGSGSKESPFFAPSVNTREDEQGYVVEVDLPGVPKEDVTIDVAGNVLRISGERREEKREESEGYIHQESSFGKFQRSFTLPGDIDVENVQASYHDGVLNVTIPKRALTGSSQPRQVPIQ